MASERLDKIISDSGMASRSEARALIKAGAVTVDGVPLTDAAARIDAAICSVMLRGEAICGEKHRYFMLNKPAGVLSATEDAQQQTVLDLLPEELRRLGLFPVGRLDKDTTGLLLLTNDGELAHKVTSPRHEIEKCYELEADGTLTQADVSALAAGIELRDGTRCRPARLEPDETDPTRARIYICEGKYHQVKRMLAAVGKPVLSLKRISEGALRLDETLLNGQCRELSAEEIELLFTK